MLHLRNRLRTARRAASGGLLILLAAAGASAAFAQTGFVHWESPHVSPVAVSPDGLTLLAVNTADNRVEIFDVSGPVPVWVKSVMTGLDPVSVRLRTSTEAWVVNHVSDTISIVDIPTGRVVATVVTGDEPADVAFAGTPQRAFVTVSQLNQVRVFDPANLSAPPAIVNITGEDPRMLAVSADGSRVYAAIFESANATTAIRQQDVASPIGPYGGVNPPPNAGNFFSPPRTPGLPPAPPVAHIVQRDVLGRWMDDNGRDWSALVTWNVLDRDVAVIDANTLGVSYAGGMLSSVMALGVRPNGVVTAVGLDATNNIRFEPNLQSTFVRVKMGSFDPINPSAVGTVDLNPHLTYAVRSIPQSQRDQSIGDPRGVVWHPISGLGFVTGMGSNTLIVIDSNGARLNQIEVGQGPTGVALTPDSARLFVVNKFDASVSQIDVSTETETARVAFHDPTPTPIRLGRPLLYNTREFSGLGHVSCASCHIDGRTDHLGWDLGNPAGQMKAFNQTCRQPVCDDWHPMKGPMVTQTLQGIIGVEPLHWRGDREDLAAFAPAFVGLMGADLEPSPAEMQAFEDFIATLRIPPNPNRNIDNTFPASLPSSLGGAGNPAVGVNLYNTLPVVGGAACVGCHGPANQSGSNRTIDDPNLPLAPQPLKMAQLRNMHEKTGWDRNSQTSNRGFGFNHHSEFGTLGQLLSVGFAFAPGAQGQQQRRDIEALMLCFSVDTHAGVGQQVTFNGPNNNDAAAINRLNLFTTIANGGAVGLVAFGRVAGEDRGFTYLSAGTLLTDRIGQTVTAAALRTGAAPGNEITFMLVPAGTQRRIGVDRDADGFLDGDERDSGSDPALAQSTPVAANRGDLNCDGVVNNFDIDPFVLALVNPGQYGIQFPGCYAQYADVDLDGAVTNFDIDVFVTDCLLGESCP
ncbi:MAG: hypothetical protein HRU75_03265 [Planctomycetia bacterium]|nr:MAG: hypothetical protein HRU75_03265 [Planctomycetia bacterium]